VASQLLAELPALRAPEPAREKATL
jgi:hypothetical protein